MKAINILSKISLVAIIVVAFTVGCDNITNPEPISAIDTTKTATIKGAATAVYDLNTGESEPVPQGTNVKVVIDSEQFVNNAVGGVNYQNLTYNTTIDGSGNYSVEVPALDDAITAEIYLDEFTATEVQTDDSEEEKLYTPDQFPYTVTTVVAGLTTTRNVTYSAN